MQKTNKKPANCNTVKMKIIINIPVMIFILMIIAITYLIKFIKITLKFLIKIYHPKFKINSLLIKFLKKSYMNKKNNSILNKKTLKIENKNIITFVIKNISNSNKLF